MSTSTLKNSKQHTKAGMFLWLSRIFVGLLFIFSGLIKANDPMGFGYKLQEYFHVFNMNFLNDYATEIAIFICGFEIILGILLLLGIAAKLVAWGLLMLIVFFTFLTFYSAFFEVVTSCGCFGDAIPLTPWESFIKDLILLVFILIIFTNRNKIKPLISSISANNFLVVIALILSFGVGIYTTKYLPFIDFLPYKEGNNLPQQMEVPAGAQPDVYQMIYTVKNKATGETKKMDDKEYISSNIWEDENWEIVGEPESKLIKKGFQVAISDLFISDAEGNDLTQEIIKNPYHNFIVKIVDVNKLSAADILALDRINTTIKELSETHNIRAVLLTASPSTDVEFLNEQMDLVLEIFYADAVPLKSMVRSNPGVMLMQNGTVLKKWSKDTFPSKDEIINNYLDN